MPVTAPESHILIYQPEDGKTRIDVRLEEESVWLTQGQMAELFQTTKQNISAHIRNIFAENALQESSVVKESLTTAADGKNCRTKLYNLDVITDELAKARAETEYEKFSARRIAEDDAFEEEAGRIEEKGKGRRERDVG